MESANESFTISSKHTLLDINNDHQIQPKPTIRNKNLKKTVSIALLILLIILIAGSILNSISKTRQPKPLNPHLSRYYCHLTMYPNLCYESMSSIINITLLQSDPSPIFYASIQVAFNQLNNASISIAKGLSSSEKGSLTGPRLSNCGKWVRESLSRLNESLSVFGLDPEIESLTFVELDEVTGWAVAAMRNALRCLSALEEIDGEEKGVEEVKLGVERARECLVNSIGLLKRRETILDDFYNPFIIEDYDYYDHYFHYRFLICMYSALYLFLALLYFLFWRSK